MLDPTKSALLCACKGNRYGDQKICSLPLGYRSAHQVPEMLLHGA
jgi:hypothetical protein